LQLLRFLLYLRLRSLTLPDLPEKGVVSRLQTIRAPREPERREDGLSGVQDQFTVLLTVIDVSMVNINGNNSSQRVMVPGVHVYEIHVLASLQDLAMMGKVDRG
jgi:hypothetical protein